jgi:hypothetical protein
MTLEEKLKLKNELEDLLKGWTYYDFGFRNEDQTRDLASKILILLERTGILDQK